MINFQGFIWLQVSYPILSYQNYIGFTKFDYMRSKINK